MTSDKVDDNSPSGCFGRKKKKKIISETSINEHRLLLSSRIEKIPHELEKGKVLSITSSALLNCQRWAINLMCGESSEADIAFHFNPRILQRCVVRNSRIKGQWGNEETLLNGHFGINHGEAFHLKIFTADDQFFVTYNERFICSFRFRVSPHTITHVELSGSLGLDEIIVEDFHKFPMGDEDLYVVEEIDGAVLNDTQMKTPFRSVLPAGLQLNWQLEVHGIPRMLPQTFSVGLREGIYLWPSTNITLQLTAYFGNNMLVRNAFIDNKWGHEERTKGNKFLPATPFSLWIRRGPKRYSIWVNGKLQAEFTYKSDPDQVKSVYIQGDVDIRGIYVNKNPEKYFLGT
ncbi:hypothetical protein WA026_009889 [Henosepilachna vigintioctopunctata]|uniref:Galectin n=1 Tax=Henosepilachna vigintioctopunctata TaxID=420089 RepID=A0AAW1TL54_9CUCU